MNKVWIRVAKNGFYGSDSWELGQIVGESTEVSRNENATMNQVMIGANLVYTRKFLVQLDDDQSVHERMESEVYTAKKSDEVEK